MTSIPPRTPIRVRPGLLAPAVVAIVLGILGMHGVDAHGVDAHGVNMHGAMAHTDAAASASVMPVHDPVAIEHGDALSTTHADMSADDHGSGDAGGMSVMVMVCVAMLAGAAAALLVLLVRRGWLLKVRAVLQPAERPWRPASHVLRVGTGPPSVWRFSVIRC